MSDIAIVGIACNFPGAKDKYQFWKNLQQATASIGSVPEEREHIFNNKILEAGFIDKYAAFDEAFFNISPREAKYMDPQQRLFMQTTWQAIEDAGISIDSLRGEPVGVYVGIMGNEWGRLMFNNPDAIDIHSGTGNGYCMVANRISYAFNLIGPSMAIDTACSSSLVAVDYACKALAADDIDMAIVGGVNLIMTPGLSEFYHKAGLSSKLNKCQPFGKDADGIVRGEGAATILLKKAAAVKKTDRVYAYIKGSAVNHNGTSNGITAPSRRAQKSVIEKAINKANISAKQILYIEAHGTGTKLGDPIEANALADVISEYKTKDEPLLIGSVKGNIGHLEGAAGIAGLIKAALSLYYKSIPASLHFNNGNEYIKFEKNKIKVVEKAIDISNLNEKYYFGVSSFGLGGTNAHVILGQAESMMNQEAESASKQIIKISGKSEESLIENIYEFTFFLNKSRNDEYIASLNNKMDHVYRLALVGSDVESIINSARILPPISVLKKGDVNKITFLFAGQGVQYAGMSECLYQNLPIFKELVDEIDIDLFNKLQIKLSDVILNKCEPYLLKETQYVQPIIYSLECALAKMWILLDVMPTYLIGHSIGEYVALYLAGAFDFETGLELVIERARIMNLANPGGMLLVVSSYEMVSALIDNFSFKLTIAVINNDRNIVVSGEIDEIVNFQEALSNEQIVNKKLNVSGAFHSPLMHKAAAEFKQFCNKYKFNELNIPVISNVTGEIIKHIDADYLANHILSPVNFKKSIEFLGNTEKTIFLEVGPDRDMISMAKFSNNNASYFFETIRKKNGYEIFLKTVKKLYEANVDINWSYITPVKKIVDMPVYQFKENHFGLKFKNTINPDIELTINKIKQFPSLISKQDEHNISDKSKKIIHLIAGVSEMDESRISTKDSFITDLAFDSLMLVDLFSKINKSGFRHKAYEFTDLLPLKTVGDLVFYINNNTEVV